MLAQQRIELAGHEGAKARRRGRACTRDPLAVRAGQHEQRRRDAEQVDARRRPASPRRASRRARRRARRSGPARSRCGRGRSTAARPAAAAPRSRRARRGRGSTAPRPSPACCRPCRPIRHSVPDASIQSPNGLSKTAAKPPGSTVRMPRASRAFARAPAPSRRAARRAGTSCPSRSPAVCPSVMGDYVTPPASAVRTIRTAPTDDVSGCPAARTRRACRPGSRGRRPGRPAARGRRRASSSRASSGGFGGCPVGQARAPARRR